MKIIFASLLALVVFSNVAIGQALYRVTVPDASGGGANVGSGTGISPTIVVTNSHVVGHNTGIDRPVSLIGDGCQCAGKVIATNDAIDMAIVRVTGGQLNRFVPLGADPVAGQDVIFSGVASGTRPTKIFQDPDHVGYLDPEAKVKVTELECDAIQGDSGGGVYDQTGNLVAVNWGAYGGHAHTTSVAYLTEWIPAIETQCGPLGCNFGGRRNGDRFNSGNVRQVFIAPRIGINSPRVDRPYTANGPYFQPGIWQGGYGFAQPYALQPIIQQPIIQRPVVDIQQPIVERPQIIQPPQVIQAAPQIIQPPAIDYGVIIDGVYQRILANPGLFRGSCGGSERETFYQRDFSGY